MDSLSKAADQAARDFLKGKRRPPEFHVTVARNAILDCLSASDEPDFIARICGPVAHPKVREEAQSVIRKIAPHIVTLAGKAYQESRA